MGENLDFLIIGGGVLGLSIGRELLNRSPQARILIVEKEDEVCLHASGRNSGVLHAGFYYSPDSLKAKFCLDGNREIKELIQKYRLPINNCGKVVVAINEDDLPRMQTLFDRGKANGVALHKYSESEIYNYEPLATTHKEFLWSPDTSVSDPIAFGQLLKDLYISAGGKIMFNTTAEIRDEDEIYLSGKRVYANQIVNAAGTFAIHLAHQVDAGQNYTQLPVLGVYKKTTSASIPLRALVYPVPNPKNPFLGVHFTLTVDGDIKIGPTAIPVLGREQYDLKYRVDMLDFKHTSKSLLSLFSGSAAGLLNLAATELPKISITKLVNDGKKLVPSIGSNIDWEKKRPGIRAQLVNLESKSFEMDFVVEQKGKFTHILNAVSPGWTSAIPFAKFIVEKYIL